MPEFVRALPATVALCVAVALLFVITVQLRRIGNQLEWRPRYQPAPPAAGHREPDARPLWSHLEPTLCNAVFVNGDNVRRCVLIVDAHGQHAGEHVYGIDPRLSADDFRLVSPRHDIRNTHGVEPENYRPAPTPPPPVRDSGIGTGRARQEWPSE